MNSRAKGKRGELEAAKALSDVPFLVAAGERDGIVKTGRSGDDTDDKA